MLERIRHLIRLRRAERWSPRRVASLRDAKLRRLFDHAARIPVYRAALAGDRPDAPPLERLRGLPVIDKRVLLAAGEGAWDGPSRDDDVWISTSGSTGVPFRFPITPANDLQRKAQYLRPYLSNGRGWFSRGVRLMALPRKPPAYMRLGLLREAQLGCDAAPEAVLDLLRATRADVLQAYPSTLRLIAQHLRATGSPPPRLRRLFTDSELLTADTRALLEATFGVPVRDVYGTLETDNIGYQCGAGAGYHLTTDTVVLELLREGQPVADGEDGEMVVTVLDNLRSPLIRYNLRDLARWLPGECTCGSRFPRFEVRGGRADDLLRWPDGTQRSAMRVVAVLDGFDDIVHLQLRQFPAGDCELRYVPAAGAGSDLPARLRAALMPHLGGCALRIEPVTAIALTRAGKLRIFQQVDDAR